MARLGQGVLVLVLLLGAAAWSRVLLPSDPAGSTGHGRLVTDAAGVLVAGVRPGMDKARVRSILGVPEATFPTRDGRFQIWSCRSALLRFDRRERLVSVSDCAASWNGRVLPPGLTQHELTAWIGPPRHQAAMGEPAHGALRTILFYPGLGLEVHLLGTWSEPTPRVLSYVLRGHGEFQQRLESVVGLGRCQPRS